MDRTAASASICGTTPCRKTHKVKSLAVERISMHPPTAVGGIRLFVQCRQSEASILQYCSTCYLYATRETCLPVNLFPYPSRKMANNFIARENKMLENLRRGLISAAIIVMGLLFQAPPLVAQQACFSAEERAKAERTAIVYRAPHPAYDPVLGYNTTKGPKKGWPRVGSDGIALPIKCVAEKDDSPGAGTTPKFHCTVPGNVDGDGDLVRFKIKPHFKGQSADKRNGEIYGEFLSSRFSKALGFFADDEWVADVTCPDCSKSLNKGYQGASFTGFEPAAGIELPLGRGLDVNCNNKDAGSLGGSLDKLLASGARRAEIDAFKLWLA